MTNVDCTLTSHANTRPPKIPSKIMYKMMMREEREHREQVPVRMK